MARTRVRITLDKKAIARLDREGGDIDTFTRKVAGQARDRAKLNLTADGSVDTGRLRNSVQYQRFPSARRRVNYQVGTNLDYGIYLESGTRDHGPRTAKVLRFRGRNGAFVFAKRVRGIRATRWLSRVLATLKI
jgi:hypothetical protein